ncbi:hypothetical protein ABIB73_007590 [Bradyrhizobium sp. F1.4.3]
MNTSLSTARPGVPRTSTRAPWNSTVTTAASADTEGSTAAGSDDSDTKGTNDKVSAGAGSTNWPKRARRRQSCTCWGRQPWRRATSVTIAPGSKLSAAICAFKSSGQRFRPAPVYTSIRDDGRLMSSEWSSIVSTLAEDDSSNGAPKTAHKQSERPRRYAYRRFWRSDSPLRTVPWAGNQPSGGQRVVSSEQVAQWPQWLRASRLDPRCRQISVVAGFPRPIHDDTQRRPCVAPERDLPSADLGAQPL